MVFHSADAALEAAQGALAHANRLVLQAGALPNGNMRREIDHYLLEYQRAISAHARLTARLEAREHSRKV